MTTMNNEDPADRGALVARLLAASRDLSIAGEVRLLCGEAAAELDRGLALQPTPRSAEERARDKAHMAAMSMPVGAQIPGPSLNVPLPAPSLTFNTKVYTADQMREAVAAERALLLIDIHALREAIEEAAGDCELHPLYMGDAATLDDIIRMGGDAAFVTGLARGLRETLPWEQPK